MREFVAEQRVGRGPVRARLCTAAVVMVAGVPSAAGAATITVTATGESPAGDGQCSLREAIAAVDAFGHLTDCGTADSNHNTIVLGAHTYTLSTGPDPLNPGNASGDLDLKTASADATTIEGAGVGQTTITGAGFPAKNPDRLLHVSLSTVTIRDLTLTGGHAPDGLHGNDGIQGADVPTGGEKGSDGGAILNGGTLELDDVVVTGNHAGSGGAGGAGDDTQGGAGGGDAGVGGGIANFGTLTLRNVTMSGNTAGSGGDGGSVNGTSTSGGGGGCCGDGGGLYSSAGDVTVIGSAFTANHAGNGGTGGDGGAAVNSGSAAGNGGNGAGGGSGGAIAITGGSLTVTDSTLAGNVSGLGGNGGAGGTSGSSGGNGGDAGNGSTAGGLFVRGGASAMLLDDTIASNQVAAQGTAGAARNGSGHDGTPGNAPFGGGVNTIGLPATVFQNTLLASNGLGNCAGSKDVRGANLSFGDSSCGPFATGDPKLGPLADNGGPTETIDLMPGSAAIDQGAACAPTDQRGVPRPSGTACDIGAYEVTPPTASLSLVTSVSATGAALNGSVTANQTSATVLFEIGTTTAYGRTAAAASVGGLSADPVSALVTGLRPATTYHYRLVASSPDGTTDTTDATFTTARAAVPRITRLNVTPRRFRTPRARGHRSGKTGTTISYTDSAAATTTLVIFRAQSGLRRSNGRCVKPLIRARGRRCTRLSRITRLIHADRAGSNRLRFDRHLAPGDYRLTVTPRAAGQTGRTQTVSFTVRP